MYNILKTHIYFKSGLILNCILLFVFISKSSFCQEKYSFSNLSFVYKNSLQVELLGTNALYSINFERVIINEEKFKTTGQLGFTYLTPSWSSDFLINAILNELISFNKHHIEMGLGYGIAYKSSNEFNNGGSFDYITLKLGYRFQKPEGRFVMKIGFTPHLIIQDDNSINFAPWGGLLFGYNFGKR